MTVTDLTPEEPPAPPLIELRPKSLQLTGPEIDFMTRLGRLVPTPRAAKRLVNIYRLVRIGIPDADLPAFTGDTSRPDGERDPGDEGGPDGSGPDDGYGPDSGGGPDSGYGPDDASCPDDGGGPDDAGDPADPGDGPYRAVQVLLAILVGHPKAARAIFSDLLASEAGDDLATAAGKRDETGGSFLLIQNELARLHTEQSLTVTAADCHRWCPLLARFSFYTRDLATS